MYEKGLYPGAVLLGGKQGQAKMSDIAELERRINNALERISAGVENLGVATDAAKTEALQAELEQERSVTAQLEERVKAIKEKQETHVRDLESKLAEITERFKEQEARMFTLKQTTVQLRENVEALRDANNAGVGDPHLINKAMLAELEALRALRDAEQAEVETLLSELKPLVGEGA